MTFPTMIGALVVMMATFMTINPVEACDCAFDDDLCTVVQRSDAVFRVVIADKEQKSTGFEIHETNYMATLLTEYKSPEDSSSNSKTSIMFTSSGNSAMCALHNLEINGVL